MEFENGSVRRNVGGGERDEGVLHPEGGLDGLRENKEHSFVRSHVRAEHHAGHLLLFGEREFGGHDLRPDPQVDGLEPGLCAGGEQRCAACGW